MQTWSLNFNAIRQNARRFKGDKGDFTYLQENFISDSIEGIAPVTAWLSLRAPMKDELASETAPVNLET